MAGKIPTAKPRTRNVTIRALAQAVSGREQPYPVFRFSRRPFFERPRHNPFKQTDIITIPTPASVPNPTVGISYSVAFATGGEETALPLQWIVSTGELPPGLSLDRSTGLLIGLPTVAGVYIWTLRVDDAAFNFGTRSITSTVAAA